MAHTRFARLRSRGLLAALLCLLGAACSRDEVPEAEPPAQPRAVVPASAGVLDIVAALLPPGSIAGLPEQTLVYSGLRDAGSPYLQRPRFERYAAESVLALAPDLVIAQTWQSGETTSRLREAGVRVQLLGAANSWEDVRAQILQVGDWLGRDAEAAQLVAGYDARVTALAEAAAGERRSGLIYNHVGAQGRVAGANTTSDAVLRLAGLTNLAAELGLEGHQNFDFEQLLAADPDVLVVGGGDEGALGATVGILRHDRRLSELAALRDGGLVVLEPWLNVTTSQYLVTAAEAVRAQLDRAAAGRDAAAPDAADRGDR